MANNRIPGPIGMAADPSLVDSGTLCITASSSPDPLSLQSFTTSQSVALALTRLANATQHFADGQTQSTQIRRKYLAECNRCMLALPPLFQRHQVSDRHAQRFTDRLSREIVGLQALIGTGTVPAFYKLLITIRSHDGAGIQALLDTRFTQLGDAEKEHLCLGLINALTPNLFDLRGIAGLFRIESWLGFMTACLVWMLEASRMAEALTWQPELIRVSTYRLVEHKSTTRPPPAPHARPSPPPPKPTNDENLAQVDQNQQAATLESAAKDGTPFCEECEKARRSQEAEAQSAA
ncbi:MAG: hypothetical protein JMN27_03720 [gamma proteobacterium endosymbiont of Lamellibrachia anaximandri]|nr:hypothetical protein [gamma proteobacterium endosymbiont of Lamellibrachia anaximandri]MBL3532921.1 hypothetical protein [gamma proteobacterium endosymbiont of Lamellibrachia anaximandri]